MAVATHSVTDICLAARDASRRLAVMSSAVKDAALLRVADALEERTPTRATSRPGASRASRTR
jgi:glutamate-5-semialdehyde dehydrogenase